MGRIKVRHRGEAGWQSAGRDRQRNLTGIHTYMCTAGDVLASLERCDGSAAPASCAAWTDQRVWPSGAGLPLKPADCAARLMQDWLCALPTVPVGPLPPVLRGYDSLQFGDFGDTPPTISKFLARWALMLYVSSTAEVPYRYVLPTSRASSWAWLPGGPHAARQREADWLVADVCARHVPSTEAGAAGLAEAIMARARGEPPAGRSRRVAASGREPYRRRLLRGGATWAGLWWAGLLQGRVLTAMGPRAAALREAALARIDEVGGAAVSSRLLRPRDCSIRVGLHVRRGDACQRWAAPADGAVDPEGDCGTAVGRPCYATSHYLHAVRSLARAHQARSRSHAGGAASANGEGCVTTILLASDSPSVALELAAAVAASRNLRLLWVNIRRGADWGGTAELSNLGLGAAAAEANFIERRNSRGLLNRSAVLGAALADISLLATAHAFVGTAASWLSRLALLCVIGQSGSVPPFALVDRPMAELWHTTKGGALCPPHGAARARSGPRQ